MRERVALAAFALLSVAVLACILPAAQAGENLVLSPKLDYNSDSEDGPLITGDDIANAELATNRPTYLFIYGEG